ncbi:MAG: LacI family DNA-binding transcriptional regulator [Rhizobiaceae bacterium]
MATIVDVANLAGVSRGTASNVFTHPHRVRQALRDKVMAAASALNYAGPNPKVRFLKGGRLNAIGVTPPGAYGVQAAFDNSYLREFLSGVSKVCDERGASLTLVSGVGDDNTWGIRNAVVDGFIIHRFEEAATIEAQRRRLPCVFVDMDGNAQTSSVRIDDRAGARAAAEHLVDLGHRKFAIFSVLRETEARTEPIFHDPDEKGRKLSSTFALDKDRLDGYLSALAVVGVRSEDVPIVETRADVISAAAAGASMLFDRAPEVTAVLAMTDVQALAVLHEAERRGIRVPQDLSVVGFDDILESASAHPPLTTVSHPIGEKGEVAARLLFGEAETQHIVLPVRLIVRSSTAAPRQAGQRSSTADGKSRPSRRRS